jgi:hypothetical protein
MNQKFGAEPSGVSYTTYESSPARVRTFFLNPRFYTYY